MQNEKAAQSVGADERLDKVDRRTADPYVPTDTDVIESISILTNDISESKQNISEQLIYQPPYTVLDGCLYRECNTAKGFIRKKLCNFLPFLVSETTYDNGAETNKYYEISGIHADGTVLPSIHVPVAEFAAMNWVAKYWGSKCNPEAGQSIKDYIRHAIQTTAVHSNEKVVYSHLGWRKISGEWQYLIPSGCGYDVCLDGNLSKYQLKKTYERDDIHSSYRLISSNLVSNEISYTLLALIYLSPLNEFFIQAGYEPKVLLTLTGKTGSKKSCLSALFLSHFGNFTHDSLPLSFRDTANSILHRLFALKDVPVVIDDFHPSTRKDETEMVATAQMLVRAFGDKTARGRMKSDLTIEIPKPPRGNGIITAEFPPDISESGTARYLNLSIVQRSVDMSVLSELQNLAAEGSLQGAMHSYIDFIKSEYLQQEKEFITELQNLFIENRKLFRKALNNNQNHVHDRIPDTCAWLRIGFLFAMRFFTYHQIITAEIVNELNHSFFNHLTLLAQKQNETVEQDKPTEKFLLKLFSLVDTGSVMLIDKNYLPDAYLSNVVGYKDDKYIYLIANAAHKHVKKLCDEQGEGFSINSNSLLAELESDGLLEKSADSKRSRPIWIGTTTKRVTFLYKNKVENVLGYTL